MSSELKDFIVEVFDDFKSGREESETKWNSNRDDFLKYYSENSDVVEDENGEQKDEGRDIERAEELISLGVAKNKVLSGYSMIIDLVLSNNELPTGMVANAWSEEHVEGNEEEAKALKARIGEAEKLLQKQYEQCKARKTYKELVLNVLMYGSGYTKNYSRSFFADKFEEVFEDGVGTNRWKIKKTAKLAPAWRRVSNFLMFHDPEAETLQDGVGVIEVDLVTPAGLEAKKGEPGWLDDEIDEVAKAFRSANDRSSDDSDANDEQEQKRAENCISLEEDQLPPYLREVQSKRRDIVLAEFWGLAPVEYVVAFEKAHGIEVEEEFKSSDKEIECHVVVAGDRIVRFVRTNEERPYQLTSMESVPDELIQYGIVDSMHHIQGFSNRMINALAENAELASKIILPVKRNNLEQDPEQIVTKRGVQILDVTSSARNINDAIGQISINSNASGIAGALQLADQLGEVEGQLPKITQGLDQNRDKTAYEASQQMTAGSKFIGGIIKNLDDTLEKSTMWMHTQNMADPDIVKGKANIIPRAKGFQMYQDKVVKLNALMKIYQLLLANKGAVEDEWNLNELLSDIVMIVCSSADKYKFDEQTVTENKTQKTAVAQQQSNLANMELQKVELEMKKALSDIAVNDAKIFEIQEKIKIEKGRLAKGLVEDALKKEGGRKPGLLERFKK